jgi:hypothetical protein
LTAVSTLGDCGDSYVLPGWRGRPMPPPRLSGPAALTMPDAFSGGVLTAASSVLGAVLPGGSRTRRPARECRH